MGGNVSVKCFAQGDIDIPHCDGQAEINKGRDAMFSDAARHDAVKVRKVRFDINRDAVKADPFAQADTDGGNFVFGVAVKDDRIFDRALRLALSLLIPDKRFHNV